MQFLALQIQKSVKNSFVWALKKFNITAINIHEKARKEVLAMQIMYPTILQVFILYKILITNSESNWKNRVFL